MTKQIISFITFFLFAIATTYAQVNQVEFGKNRVQYKKLKWEYFQTPNFNVYFYKNGEQLAKFVAQVAEEELPQIENFTEYSMQRRANLVLYNTYNEFKQTNIGQDVDWVSSGGVTKLVNNKAVVYYTNDHQKLKSQVRVGIAKILTENVLFGDDIGEVAGNQALLDLPKWLTEGYYHYVGENWSAELDEELRNEMLNGEYKTFAKFAYKRPRIAGHGFWHYIETKYKKENVTYFLYLARVYKNLNTASLKITGMKFNALLKTFMEEVEDEYWEDVNRRKQVTKGNMTISEDVTDNSDWLRFAASPKKRDESYTVVRFRKGIYTLKLYNDSYDGKNLLRYGNRTTKGDIDPIMPIVTWDNKGEYISCIYYTKGKTKLFVYDAIRDLKMADKDISQQFDQVQNMVYMTDNKRLLLSATRNGQSDVFIYHIENETIEQVTNDVYTDKDATFVTFPSKTGIIFSSNRPNINAANSDTVLPSNYNFNIFLADYYNKTDYRQLSQLTSLKYGNATLPMQYNMNHFTFVCDENGIGNRFAGFFNSSRDGLDTLIYINDVILRNPSEAEFDSAMRYYKKEKPDSVSFFSVTKDSTYIFPITNYQSSIIESRVAGDNDQVTEVTQQGNSKYLYKLKIDEQALRRRNVSTPPTPWRKKMMEENRLQKEDGAKTDEGEEAADDPFQTNFNTDSSNNTDLLGKVFSGTPESERKKTLEKSKKFKYRWKFSADRITSNLLSNEMIGTRYQPYNGGEGPVVPTANGGSFNGNFKATIVDVLEDLRLTGGIRLPLGSPGSLTSVGGGGVGAFVPVGGGLFSGNSELFLRGDYFKHRMDYTVNYYRSLQQSQTQLGSALKLGNLLANVYQLTLKWPFNENKSLRIHAGVRVDKFISKAINEFARGQWVSDLTDKDYRQQYALVRFEYVYDNSQEKATNIWHGTRYKAYADINGEFGKRQLFDGTKLAVDGKPFFNFGFDGRHYHSIFRNFIWATRVAADFSVGNQKMIYYLGGVDNWQNPKWTQNQPDPNENYVYQSLALNLRGFNQNIANGNNAAVVNTELRLPIFTTLFDKPINNVFLRHLQVAAFMDLGTAWAGSFTNIARPSIIYPTGSAGSNPTVLIKAGGIGPLAGGYGMGLRSSIIGNFIRADFGWPMNEVFYKSKPRFYLAFGVDF
jgi:hypothetical protein